MLFRTVLQQESDQLKNFFIPSIYFNSVVTKENYPEIKANYLALSNILHKKYLVLAKC